MLRSVSILSLSIDGICLLIISADLLMGHAQKMWIMNIVWPITALYAGPIALIAYYTIGRKSMKKINRNYQDNDQEQTQKKPFWQSVTEGTLHCGSGCTLGDIIAEFGLLVFPVTLFGSSVYGSWLVDYIIAFLTGIIFQYYAIKPMKNLSAGKAIKAALQADTLSLTSWQIGMYGWMAISIFIIFNRKLEATDPIFWFLMQIGMLFGFITAYPVNWWLMKKGIKEAM